MDIELILDALHEARLDNDIQVAGNGKEGLAILLGEGDRAISYDNGANLWKLFWPRSLPGQTREL